MKSYILLYCLLFSLAVNAQRKIERAIAKELAFNGAQISVSVFDLEKQKDKVSYRSEINILPASTIKLSTFLGSLQTFEKSLPILHYIKQEGRFYFWSSGYPLINHPKYDSGEVLHFLAKQQDSLFYVPRPMTSPALGFGWAWDDQGYAFSAKKSSFPIHGNLIQVIAIPSKNSLRVYPPVFRDSIVYIKDALFYNINVNKHEYRLRVDKADTLYIPFTPSDAIVLKVLEEKLGKPIYIDNKFDSLGLEYKTLSTNKINAYEALLRNSDNHIAESLLLMLSGTTQWELNTQAGLEILELNNEFLLKEINQVDGSGLSRYNLVSPNTIIEILNELYNELGDNGVKLYFPQLNSSGTLKNYAPNFDIKTVYAKSGSLKNNHILAGYLYSDIKRPYAFVISANNFTGDKQSVKLAMAKLLLRFRKKFQ